MTNTNLKIDVLFIKVCLSVLIFKTLFSNIYTSPESLLRLFVEKTKLCTWHIVISNELIAEITDFTKYHFLDL